MPPPSARGVSLRPSRRRARGHLEPHGRALARAGVDLERAAHEQRPLAHAGQAEALALLGEREAACRCRRPAGTTRESRGSRLTSMRLAPEWRAAFTSASWATR